MSTNKRALGKGLAALIGDDGPNETNPQSTTVTTLPITQLEPNKEQPRRHFNKVALEELKQSIQVHGVLQPILVRPLSGEMERYEIIAGERRWRASKLAGLKEVPVVIKVMEGAMQRLEVALLENIQREDLSAIEEAQAYFRLIETYGHTQEELANAVGKSRSHIANLVRLLMLPDNIKKMLEAGDITMGHARAVLGHLHADKIIEQVVQRGLNVRQTEALAKRLSQPESSESSALVQSLDKTTARGTANQTNEPREERDPDIIALEETLSETLGIPVRVQHYGTSGNLVLKYDNLAQLDQLLRRLGAMTI